MTSNSNGWIGDGSSGSTLSAAVDGAIMATAASRGTPFYVRQTTPMEAGDSSFAVTLVSGSASIGLVALDGFRGGWKTRGMFYNGNATNGSAALITGFGPSISAGDEVLVCKIERNGLMEVNFSVNGRPLGTAFCLDASNGGTKTFFPCVGVSASATFVYQDAAGLRRRVLQEAMLGSNNDASYEGDWRLDRLSMNDQPIGLPSTIPIVLRLGGGPEPTTIGIQVTNTMSGSIRVIGQGEDPMGRPGALEVAIGPLRSTRRMPSPELWELEQVIARAIPRVTKMTIIGENSIYMTGVGEGYPEITASRYTKTFEPLTHY